MNDEPASDLLIYFSSGRGDDCVCVSVCVSEGGGGGSIDCFLLSQLLAAVGHWIGTDSVRVWMIQHACCC